MSVLISVNNRAHLPKTQTQIEDHPNYFKYNIYGMSEFRKKENLPLDHEFKGILIGSQCDMRNTVGFENNYQNWLLNKTLDEQKELK